MAKNKIRADDRKPRVRAEAVAMLATDPWYGPIWARLSMGELVELQRWMRDHDHLTRAEFEVAVNRMYIGVDKPARWKEIMELLTVANGMMRWRDLEEG